MKKPFVKTNLTCSTCGKTITHARPLRIAQAGIATYTGNRHVIRFDGGTVYVSKCPKTRKVR